MVENLKTDDEQAAKNALSNRIISVLIIEDSDADAKLISAYLPSARYEIKRVSLLEEATGLLSKERNFDIIILDLNLPGVRGKVTYAKFLKYIDNDIPVIVLTDNYENDTEFIKESLIGGVQDYLEKDNLVSEILIRSINYSLSRHMLIRYIRQIESTYRADRKAFSEQVINTWQELTYRLSSLYISLHSSDDVEGDDFMKRVSEYTLKKDEM